ncbi:probable phospholipid hydroperoxide glutathione peroxidase isoform X2 [Formica exsecta]|uniref:probable phospholipid hydroperoxide glutathione peroxidase isoform X2 n=1 Tax=Formica exsecta TaxID=72781 RepID=UPI001143EC5D|nr:probable phospholipid hydroperoxide glutathione peroxidase isoform X2 [Formica exsecta]
MRGIASIFLFLVISRIIAQECKDKTLCFVPSEFNQNVDWESATSVYNFDADDIMGNNISLEKYRNHVLIIVNVASNCGLTDINYKQLQELYNKYNNREGLRILAFPSNQFADQEPGTSKEIRNFVKRYNVTFDIFNKVNVNGENAHPLWKWLKTQKDGFITNDIKWNFTKFIIDKKGKVMERFSPSTEPLEMEETLKKYF